MPVRTAQAVWNGSLRDGNGNMKFGGGAFDGAFSFGTRFGEDRGTNPEELIAAAHAGCFSMAFSAVLNAAGYTPKSIATKARVGVDKDGDGFSITGSQLSTEADIPGISDEEFQKLAEEAKSGCPVSKALAGVNISLDAKLIAP